MSKDSHVFDFGGAFSNGGEALLLKTTIHPMEVPLQRKN